MRGGTRTIRFDAYRSYDRGSVQTELARDGSTTALRKAAGPRTTSSAQVLRISVHKHLHEAFKSTLPIPNTRHGQPSTGPKQIKSKIKLFHIPNHRKSARNKQETEKKGNLDLGGLSDDGLCDEGLGVSLLGENKTGVHGKGGRGTYLVDVRQDTTTCDGRTDKLVELFVTSNS
jgi:hypothetical protein